MDDQPNPYESPRTESRLEEAPRAPTLQTGDGWKFVALGVAILCGLVSFVPWLAAIIAVLSAPVFIRYFVLRRQAAGEPGPSAGTIISGVTGSIGLAMGIVAASAGSFLGVCSVTTWSSAMVFAPPFGQEFMRGIMLAFYLGLALGGAAFILAGSWLIWRLWPSRASAST